MPDDRAGLEHDPEKWKDHAQSEKLDHDAIRIVI